MKQFFALLLACTGFTAAQAQVAISNPSSAPDPSAMLDVKSANKGFLMPRVINRTNVLSPATGLLVYETASNAVWVYNGTAWVQLGSGGGASQWITSGTHIYNGNTGNVGIGITAPTAKLHLAGLMKIDGGQIDIDDNLPQVRLLDGGSPKGFFRLGGSSGDIELGTYVGANDIGKVQLLTKTSPRLTVMPDGNIGIGTIAPDYKLDVRGDIGAVGNLRLEDGYVRMTNTSDSKNWEMRYSPSLGGRLLFLQQGLERMILRNDGNIGIGGDLPLTNNGFPQTKLHIESGEDAGLSSNNNGHLMIGSSSSTNIVIDNNEIIARNGFTGTSTLYLQNDGGELFSGARLTINKDGEALKLDGNQPAINLYHNGTQKGYIWQTGNNLTIGVSDAAGKIIVNTNQMQIGTSINLPAGYKLGVGGKVLCEEVRVKLQSSGWPDYVFSNKYKLMPLADLQKFIQQNNHLPNIPKASTIEKEGLEVGDMQKKLMEKVEELTLYILDLQKQIDELKTRQPNK